MSLYWFVSGRTTEGRAWMQQALASASGMNQHDRARALSVCGLLTFGEGEHEQSQSLLREAAESFDQLGDRRGLAWTLVPLSFAFGAEPELESLAARLDASIGLMREVGFGFGLALALAARGRLAFYQRDDDLIYALLDEALVVSEQVGDSLTLAMATSGRGWIAAQLGQPELAMNLCRRALDLFLLLGSKGGCSFAMEGLAVAETASGSPLRAIHLFAAADALRESAVTPAWPAERVTLDRAIAGARAAVGDEEFEAAWQAGRAMSSSDAVALALGSQLPP
jgi:tetratricopeptide (TPR) repeat protein